MGLNQLRFVVLILYVLGLSTCASCQEPKSAPRESKGVSVERAERAVARHPRNWAVVVGVNQYDDPEISNLLYCVSDAKLVVATLSTWCGYDRERILLITHDQKSGHFQPRRQNLVKQIPMWLEDVEEGDTVFIFFSGHGFLQGAGEGEIAEEGESAQQGYLALQDSEKSKLRETALKTSELRDMLDNCPAKKKILVLDCCHAGGFKGDGEIGPSSEELSEAFRMAKGLLALCSCAKEQSSHEWGLKKQGIFTWFLAQGLKGAADKDGDRVVDGDELYRYLADRVPPAAQKAFKVRQTPTRIVPTDGVFAIARTDVMTNSLDMKFRKVSPGEFEMGSPEKEAGHEPDEKRHAVSLSTEFFCGQHEVTQQQYERVVGTNPSYFSPNGEGKADVADAESGWLPVEMVCWDDAREFCRQLSERPEERAAGRSYRLPTEAEWEYACRAGSRTAFNTGDTLPREMVNVSFPDAPATRTIPVDYCPPNAWGLCGMHDNVREWCADWYGETYYELPSHVNPTGPDTNPDGCRVLRGGSFQMQPKASRSAFRGGLPHQDVRHSDIGFRVVCEVQPPSTPDAPASD